MRGCQGLAGAGGEDIQPTGNRRERQMAMNSAGEEVTVGETVVFWSWIGMLSGGLAAMITIGLSGR